MVPYGQAAYSETGENMETYGQTHSHGTLRAGFALRDRREQCTQETGENDKNSVLAWYPTGRLRTLLPTPLFLHGLLTMPKGCGDLRSNSSHGQRPARTGKRETGESKESKDD